MAARLVNVFNKNKLLKLLLSFVFLVVGSLAFIGLCKVIVDAASNKIITDFLITDQIGDSVINNTDNTVYVVMPYGTNVTNLVPTIGIQGKTPNGLSPEGGIPQDFTLPVLYTVTAVDLTTRVYTVSVHVQTLGDLQTLAINELGSDYSNYLDYHYSEYTSGNWTVLFGFYTDGVTAINAAGNPADITTAKETAINGMAGVPTIAETLAAAKVTAKADVASALTGYSSGDYTTDDWTTLNAFHTDGDTAIDAATDLAGVGTAKTAALDGMAGVPTIAETLAAAKVAAHGALTTAFGGYISNNYTSGNWATLTGYKTDGDIAITAATDLAGVGTAQSTATTGMSGVQTIAAEVLGFQTTHATALDLTVGTVVIGDRDIVEAADSAYTPLSDEAKALLTTEKALIDALLTKLNTLDAEAEALNAVNAANSGGMPVVISNYHTTLGLVMTDFNGLSNQDPVFTALVGQSFANVGAVKTAFDNAVATEKAAEDLATYKVNLHSSLATTLSTYVQGNYTPANWTILTGYKTAGDTAIDNATDMDGAMAALNTATSSMAGVYTIAHTLSDAKTAAHGVLTAALAGYTQGNYTSDNWTTLTGFKTAGDTAIDAATDLDGVSSAQGTATTGMAGVQTIAQTLAAAKVTAHGVLTTALGTYTEGNYTPANWTILTGFKTTGDTAIDAATDLAGVSSAQSTATGAMAGVYTIAHTLSDAKTAAHGVLTAALAGYTQGNYTSDNWTTLTGFKTAGDTAIDAATDLDGVSSAQGTATTGMAGVQTIAQTLAAAKVTAHGVLTTALGTYTEGNYTGGNWTTLTGFKTAGDTAIDAATDLDGVSTAQGTATTGMAAVQTIVQTLAAAKVTAHGVLTSALAGYTEGNYTGGNWTTLTGYKTTGDTAIDAATDLAGVSAAQSAATTGMAGVYTIAHTLSDAKTAAHGVLTSALAGYTQGNYTSGNWTTLTGFKTAGDTAIDAATDLDGVSSAQGTATSGMAGVDTDLADARVAAHSALNIALGTYTEGNYTTANWTVLTGYKTTGDAAIDSASTTTAVSLAQSTATTAMAGVQTIAQTLAATKIAVKAELVDILSIYVETNYTPGNWTTLTGFVTTADTAIDNAVTIGEVYTARNAASVEMNGVETIGVSLQNAKNAVGALTSSDYTIVTWGAVTTAMGLPEATYSDKVTKIEAITNAIAALVDKADLTAYSAALAAVHQADYTSDSWTAYQLVVAANEVTVENSQADVNDATAAITAAQADLVFLPLVVVGQPGIVINGGAAFTNSANVTLTLSAENATHMAFSNDGGNTWSDNTEVYSTTKAYTLVGGDGNDIAVRVRFFDVHGTPSGSDGCSASINLNSTLSNGDVTAINQVISQIAALPAVGDLILTDGTAVAAARSAYDALTTDQQTLITNYSTLTAAEAQIAVLKAAADAVAAQAVIDQIGALPAVGDLVLGNGTAVSAARTAFNNLTADQQNLVVNISHLTDDEAQIVVLQAAADLASAKTTAHGALNTALAGYTQGNYTTENWTTLTGYKATGDAAIEAATDLAGVSAAQSAATTAMAGVPSIAQTLAAAKVAAHSALTVALATYIQGNYTSDNWTALNGFKTTGDTAIDAAIDLSGVSAAQSAATTGMVGVQTIAQTLAAAKVTAHGVLTSALAGYTQGNYTSGDWTTLNGFKTTGDTAIDAATDLAGVSAAQSAATTGMAGVQTIAQTLAAAKVTAHSALTTALGTYAEANYTSGDWTTLNGFKTTGDTAIDAASDLAGVSSAQSAATTAMAGVQTITQLLSTAEADAAALTSTDYTVASWGAVTDALALPETNNTEKADKTTAINAAIAALVSDTTGPVITINNPGITVALSKTVTASTDNIGSPDTLTMFTNAVGVSTCDDSLSPFVAYSSTTFTAEADNGRTICYKAVDSAHNTTYTVSDSIAGIDTSAPVMDAGTAQHTYPNVARTFTGTSTDNVSGVDDSTIVWTKESGAGTVTFGTDNVLTTTVSADTVGTYTLRLTSADNLANTGHNDTQLIVNKVADYNNDGVVDELDFAYMAVHWNSNDLMADFNGDGIVDELDFATLAINWTIAI
jgi:hypothetical protein